MFRNLKNYPNTFLWMPRLSLLSMIWEIFWRTLKRIIENSKFILCQIFCWYSKFVMISFMSMGSMFNPWNLIFGILNYFSSKKFFLIWPQNNFFDLSVKVFFKNLINAIVLILRSQALLVNCRYNTLFKLLLALVVKPSWVENGLGEIGLWLPRSGSPSWAPHSPP